MRSIDSKAINNLDKTRDILKEERERKKENITKFLKLKKEVERRIEFLDKSITLVDNIEKNHNEILRAYNKKNKNNFIQWNIIKNCNY